MQLNRSDLRLFGLDLVTARDYLRAGWCEAMRWPFFAWLTPAEPVRFLRIDGSEEIWRGDRRIDASRGKEAAVKAVRFSAREIPEEKILRRRLTLPAMPETELAAAVEFDARGASPFVGGDLLWGYAARSLSGGRREIELVLASRAQLEQYLQQFEQTPSGATPEAWAICNWPECPPILFAGYGEAPRLRRMARNRWGVVALLVLLFLLLGALAVTPTAQLRARAIDASTAYSTLLAQVQPLVQMREQLVVSGERLAAVNEIFATRADALPALELVTRLLPDDTFLQRLDIQGSTVRISGQTDNSANLMQALGAHPGLRDVRAPSAATRLQGAVKESFTIEFTFSAEASAQ